MSRHRHEPSATRRDANRARTHGPAHRRVRARRIVPGARYKVTKRCLERRFFLVPDRPEVTQIIGFCLALCLQRFGLELHAACFMSNHYHLDVTDPHGQLPAFKCMLNSFLARSLNRLRGRFDKFWSGDPACDVEIVDDADVIASLSYTLANPVSAGLVRRATRWPGFSTAGMRFGARRCFRRPAVFFDAENADVPENVTIELVRPRVSLDRSDDQFYEDLLQAVHAREVGTAKKLVEEHRRFLGEHHVQRQRWTRRPPRDEVRFTATPRVSARSKWSRISALQRHARWASDYAQAYERRLSGVDAVFPYGTYALRRFAGVRVAAPP